MYKTSEVAERIRQCAKQQGKSVNEMLIACGLGKNTVAKLSKDTDILTTNLAKIADYLDCSVDYLLGRDGQKEKPAPTNGGELDPELADLIRRIPTHRMPEVQQYLRYLIACEEKP